MTLGRAHQRAYEDPHRASSVREYPGLRTGEDGQYFNAEPTPEEVVADAAHEGESHDCAYYENWRTHLSLGKDAPQSRRIQPPADGEVVEIPDVGGLHHHYERRAA